MNDQGRHRASLNLAVSAIFVFLISALALSQNYTQEELIAKSTECLDCHSEAADNLQGSMHQLTPAGGKMTKIAVGCIGCHSGWEKHLENPSKENIVNPANELLAGQAKICATCHVTQHQTNMVSDDPHARAQLQCTTCHTVHGNNVKGLVKDARQNFCTACHIDVAAEFKRRSAHPLESGNIRCSDCHSFTNTKDNMLARGIDWTCQNCHSEYSGPFAFEHQVTEKHLFNGGGCTECHNPHGSPNDRLLTEAGNGVCIQCHGIPPRHRTEHSGLGAKVDCVNCHTGFHGSNDNSKLLDPQLPTKFFADCYQSGCHDHVK